MKHAIDESTRAVVRGIITTIRIRHNVTRAVAEDLFRRGVSDSGVITELLESVDEDLEEQKQNEEFSQDFN